MGDSMSTIINATTTNGVVIQPDNSGSLVLQTNNGTTALTISTAQDTTLAGKLTSAGALTLASNGTTTAITIDTSQRAAFVAGTAAAPAITTTGDTNTGIFFSAADTIDFAEGGVACGQFDSSANFKFNSGYGSVATAYGCRAWVNFNGTGTVAIRASGNVTSITDNGTGDYTINFTTAMPDANYSFVGNSYTDNSTYFPTVLTRTFNTSSCQLNTNYVGVGLRDSLYVTCAIFR
jgi:hypothetical protein